MLNLDIRSTPLDVIIISPRPDNDRSFLYKLRLIVLFFKVGFWFRVGWGGGMVRGFMLKKKMNKNGKFGKQTHAFPYSHD